MKFFAFAKRIMLFLALNFIIMFTISMLLRLFNVSPYLTKSGLNITSLMVFCFIWGMTGALISLACSRMMAKWLMDVKIIDPEYAFGSQKVLLDTVYRLARKAGLSEMPEVGIYTSYEVNAFATGPSQSRSLVAVSSALLHEMNSDEVEGVLAHEISHIANGDMVTLTLLQGVVNAFVMFFARVVAYSISRMYKRSDEPSNTESLGLYHILSIVFEIVFMILGAMVVATFSRFREYRADEGGARLAGTQKMIGALQALQAVVDVHDERKEAEAFQSMKISNTRSILHLFSTHPPLADRIARLKGEK